MFGLFKSRSVVAEKLRPDTEKVFGKSVAERSLYVEPVIPTSQSQISFDDGGNSSDAVEGYTRRDLDALEDLKAQTQPGQNPVIKGVYFDAGTLTESDLSEIKVINSEFNGCTFSNCNLTGIELENVVFTNCKFIRCRIDLDIYQSIFSGCEFRATDIYNIDNGFREFSAFFGCSFLPELEVLTEVPETTSTSDVVEVEVTVSLGRAGQNSEKKTVYLSIEPCRLGRLSLWSSLLMDCKFRGVSALYEKQGPNFSLDGASLVHCQIDRDYFRAYEVERYINRSLGRPARVSEFEIKGAGPKPPLYDLDVEGGYIYESYLKADIGNALFRACSALNTYISSSRTQWASFSKACFTGSGSIRLDAELTDDVDISAENALFSPYAPQPSADKLTVEITKSFNRFVELVSHRASKAPGSSRLATGLQEGRDQFVDLLKRDAAAVVDRNGRATGEFSVRGTAFATPSGLAGEEESGSRSIDFTLTNFSDTDLAGICFQDVLAPGVVFDGADLEGADFTGAILCDGNKTASMINASLTETNFAGAKLMGANFSGAALGGARFVANVNGKHHYADIRHAIFVDAKGFIGNEFTNLDLTGVKLPDDLKDFGALRSIERLSVQARNLLAIALLGAVYSVLTMTSLEGGTTQEITLPVLEAGVPGSYFAIFAAFSLLAVFGYFHSKLQSIWEEIVRLPVRFPDGRPVGSHIYPFIITSLASPLRGKDRTQRTSRRHRFLADLVERAGAILAGWMLVPTVIGFIAFIEFTNSSAGAEGLGPAVDGGEIPVLVALGASVLIAGYSFTTMWITLRSSLKG